MVFLASFSASGARDQVERWSTDVIAEVVALESSDGSESEPNPIPNPTPTSIPNPTPISYPNPTLILILFLTYSYS